MTRGKYGAKAKNRLANLDNEILQEIIKERDVLKTTCTELKAQIESLKREENASAMRRASVIAHEEMERARVEMAQIQRDHAAEKEELAFKLFDMLNKDATKIMKGNWDGLAELFGMGDRIGELTFQGEADAPRRARRSTAKKARRSDSHIKQAKSTHGVIYQWSDDR